MNTPKTLTALQEFIQSKCSGWVVPGLALLMAERGQITYRYMHGFREVSKGLPVTEETVFGVASVTKSVTALAIMQAHDQGLLSVDDPVVKWLPELKNLRHEYINFISVHHLLTHTAGFPGMSALFRARAMSIRQDPDWELVASDMPNPFDIEPISTYRELIDVMCETDFRLLGNPGEVFNYSNEGYALLQGILERATNQSFIDFVRNHILIPLQMRNSVFRTSDLVALPEVTQLYAHKTIDGQRITFASPTWWDVGQIYSNGSLKSSAADIIRYLEVFRTGGVVDGQRLLSEESYKRMTTRHINLPTGYGYGYGLHVDHHHGVRVLAHSGGIKGVSADIVVVPSTGLTIVALSNIANVPVSQLTTALLNATLELPLTAPTVEYPITNSPARLEPYVGHYESDEGSSIDIRLTDRSLILLADETSMQMLRYADDGFVDRTGTLPIHFLRDKYGNINALFIGVRVLSKR